MVTREEVTVRLLSALCHPMLKPKQATHHLAQMKVPAIYGWWIRRRL